MVQYASRKMEDWLANEIEGLKVRVAKLEAKPISEIKQSEIKKPEE